MEAKFQMDCNGNFRIVVGGKESHPTFYQGVASVEVDGDKYIGVSQYFADIPPEQVFKLIPVDSTTEDAPMCNLFRPEEQCIHK